MLLRLALLTSALWLSGCTLGDDAELSAALEAPAVGDCRLLTSEAIKRPADATPTVPCDERHTAETFVVGSFPARLAGDEIDDPALADHVFDTCERKFRSFLGGDESLVMRSTVTWSWFRPTDAAWDEGARWWRCDVVGGGEQSTALVDLPRTTQGLLLGRPDDRWMACVNGPTVTDSDKIPCSRKHTWRAATTIVLGDEQDPYPGDDVVLSRTRDFCSDSVGAWLGYPVAYDYAYTYFHEPEWEAGNRRSICWARTSE